MIARLGRTQLALVVGLLLVALGCAPEPANNSTTSTGAAQRDGAFFKLSLDQALARAKADDRLVMVDFYADWCGPCKLLDDTTWKDAKVQEWLALYTIAIKINVDKEPKAAEKYNISSIPALVFLKPDGTEIGRLEGYRKAEAFLEEASEIVATRKDGSKK